MKRRIIAVICIAALVLLGTPTLRVAADTASESRFVSLINYERTTDTRTYSCGRAGGLNSLTVYSDLVAVARKHSQKMAAQGYIEHDSSTWNSVSGWTEYGENVGEGPSNISNPVGNLHTAFMNSAEHCQNILFSHTYAPFNEVGVGVVVSGDTMYVTEIFVRRSTARPVTPTPAPTPMPRKLVRHATCSG